MDDIQSLDVRNATVQSILSHMAEELEFYASQGVPVRPVHVFKDWDGELMMEMSDGSVIATGRLEEEVREVNRMRFIRGGGIPGGSGDPVWAAAMSNYMLKGSGSHEFKAQLIGTGTPTFDTPADMLLPDHEGVFVEITEDTMPVYGARWDGGVPYTDDASGNPLSVMPSLSAPPAATNAITYSRDLTNAVWTDGGGSTPTYTYDQVGLTGEPNTATIITDSTNTGSAWRQRSITIPATDQVNTQRYFIKKDSDTTRFVAVGSTGEGGANSLCHINTSTGAFAYEAAHVNVLAEVNSIADWWEVVISVHNDNASTSPTYYVMPARSTVIGTPNVLATGSIKVGNAELHLNRTIEDIAGTPPIVTAAATVTNPETGATYDSGNMSDTSGALYAEVTQAQASEILSTFLEVSGANFQLNDGTNTATRPWVTDTAYQVGIAWNAGENLMSINVDGTWSADATYDGTLLSGALDLFRNPAGFNSIRKIKRYPAASLARGKALIDGDMP